MYCSYFELRENPFAITPDPRFLFLSERHREALAHLLYGVGEEGGFVQLTGEVGTGKTTLCRSLLEQAPGEVDLALILNPKQTEAELLATICDELGVAYPEGTRSIKVLVDRLNRHLLEAHTRGRRTVLVIDEAQSLSTGVLEQVRLLTNLETTTHKLLQILLIGQPELQELMARPELRQLAQRVTARYHLTPLSRSETAAYVEHRLVTAGGRRPLFTSRALALVHRLSGGVPRRVNILCDRALLGAYARQAPRVGRSLVRLAVREVDGAARRRPARRRVVLAMAVAVAALAGIAWRFSPVPLPGGWPGWTSLLGMSGPTAPALPADPAPGPAASQAPAREPVSPEPPVPAEEETPATVAVAAEPASESLPVTQLPAVPGAKAAPEPEPAAVAPEDFARLLAAHAAETDLSAAFAALFRQWGLQYDRESGVSACGQAEAAGLRCLYRHGNWTSLGFLNRPAVLELIPDGGPARHVAVVSLGPEDVSLDLGGQLLNVPRDELEPLWFGSFILLWRPPEGGPRSLRVGSSGPAVAMLRRQLARAGVAPSSPADAAADSRFDVALGRRVKEFQRSRGLAPDGVVGINTWLQLDAVAGAPPAPLLTP